ncbi:MAG: hypothetical protein IKS96_07435 [Fibrobacter sp.]|nr:hypothetical protein [Fibrobacter sp.]
MIEKEFGFIELKPAPIKVGRICMICNHGFILRGPDDRQLICPECSNALNELEASRKCNWEPNSKGGEPNCKR